MRRLLVALVGIAALGLLVACGGGTTASKKTPADQTPAAGTPTSAVTQEEISPAMSFAEACVNTGEKSFSSAPPRIIDTNKTYTATITLATGGEIVLELFSDVPITTNNFVFLACKGYYDGVTFHRVLPGFMAQGGDPAGTGRGGPGYSIPDEDDGGHTFDEGGAVSMAKSGPNTTGSQFFITYGPTTHLESGFTVFGKLIEGADVHEGLTPRDPDENPNFVGDAIETITIEER